MIIPSFSCRFSNTYIVHTKCFCITCKCFLSFKSTFFSISSNSNIDIVLCVWNFLACMQTIFFVRWFGNAYVNKVCSGAILKPVLFVLFFLKMFQNLPLCNMYGINIFWRPWYVFRCVICYGCFKFSNANSSLLLTAYQRGKKCSFFGKFGTLCFLETPVLRFAFCLITDDIIDIISKYVVQLCNAKRSLT